jgi:ACS family hexuronate transporter-like MFS transporter
LTTTNPSHASYAPETPKSNLRWVVCGLLFLATTINYVDRTVFSLLEPALKQVPFMEWSSTNPEVYNNHFATILAWFSGAYGVGLLFAGRIIDRIGTKTGYALVLLIWSLAAASHSLVGSVTGFIVARILLGLGEAGNFPAAIKATTEWFPTEERALATGIFNSGTNVAAFVAPYIVAWVATAYGWKAAFLFTGVLGFGWLLLWLPFPYNQRRRSLTATQANLQFPVVEVVPTTAERLLTHRGLYGFIALKFLTDPIWWFFLYWLPKYFNERFGFNMKQNALPLLIIYGGSTLGSIAGGWLSGYRMKRGATINAGRKSALLTCAICALFTMLVPYTPNAWYAIGLLTLATAAHQGFSANVFSTATDMFPSTRVSTVVGIGGAAGALGSVIFTKFTGWVWVSHPYLIFFIAGSAYILALGIFHLLVPRLGQKLPPSPIAEPINQ